MDKKAVLTLAAETPLTPNVWTQIRVLNKT